MTISSTTRIAGPFLSGTALPFSFKVFAASDLDVVRLNVSTGVEATLVLNTDYTVALNGNQNSNPGGTVNLTVAASATSTVTITSDIANLQPTDLTNQGGFYPEVINDSLDRATIQIQQMAENVSRSIKAPVSDGTPDMELPAASVRANAFLAFDANGKPTIIPSAGSGSPVGSTSASLVSYDQGGTGAAIRSVQAKLRDAVSVKDFGAVGDGVADDTAAVQAAITASSYVVFPTATYRITSTITLTGDKTLESDNATIAKDFNGVGLAFTGGSSFNYIVGTLTINAVGSFVASTGSPSANPSAHGVTITNNRVIIDGSLVSNNHQGNGLLFTSSSANSNRCILTDVRCTGNGVNGIRFSGTNDNAAVWKVGLFCTLNRESGIYFDNDFIGRSWDGFVYCEGNAINGTSDQLYIGKLRGSRLFVYAEETVSTGYEIFIGANCEFLDIVDTRETGSVNNAALSCRISRGNKQLVVGDTSFYGYIDCVNLTNSNAKYADLVYETAEGTIAKDRIRGSRSLERFVINPTNDQATHSTQEVSQRTFAAYGNVGIDRLTGANGTLTTPTAKSVGEVVVRQQFAIQTAQTTAYDAVSVRLDATSIGGGNKASGDLIWSTTANGASSQTDAMQLTQDGNFEILQNGKGIRLRQPNGTVRLVTVNNSGTLVVT